MTDRLGYAFVVHHTSGQLVNKLRQRLPLGLAHIEHSDCPKTYALHQLDGRGCGAVRGRFLHFLPSAVRTGGEYGDTMLAPLDLSAKFSFPIVITCNMRSIRTLHENQHGVAKTVMMELRHGREVCRILAALENIRNALLQLVSQCLQSLTCGKLFLHRTLLPAGWRIPAFLTAGAACCLGLHLQRNGGVTLRSDQNFRTVKLLLVSFDLLRGQGTEIFLT